MNPMVLFVTLARAGSLALSLAGQAKLSQIFDGLASAAESGVDVEAHMAEVKAKLEALHAEGKTISDADWDEVIAGIESGSSRLQGS